MWKDNEKRIKLIEDLYSLQKQWWAGAESASMNAIRYPKDKDKQEYARECVIRHNTIYQAINKVIDLVNKHWPLEENNE